LNRFVLDASVAAKWVLPEQGETLSREAVLLLTRFAGGEVEFAVPDLFWPEVGNILWKCVRTGRIGEASALEGLARLQALRIPSYPSEPLLVDAATIAFAFDRTVYDSIYVALAVLLGRRLVTADERLANAVGIRLPVVWLGAAL
jgi:predicted nucleic acid-binding protein